MRGGEESGEGIVFARKTLKLNMHPNFNRKHYTEDHSRKVEFLDTFIKAQRNITKLLMF